MTYFNVIRPIMIATLFANVPVLTYAQIEDVTANLTIDDVVQIGETCIDIAAARDIEAGTGPAVDWGNRSPGRAELTRNQDSALNISVVVTDVGIASSGGCEMTFRKSEFGPDVFARLLADRDPQMDRGAEGFCHNGTFIEAAYWGTGDDYISSLDINSLIIFSNSPRFGEDPCAS